MRTPIASGQALALLALCAPLVHCASDPLPYEDSGLAADPGNASILGLQVPRPEGQWVTLPDTMDINPIHAVVLHEDVSRSDREVAGRAVGTVLVVSGSGDYWAETDFSYKVWDLASGVNTTSLMYFDAFCGGITVLSNGNPFVAGGTSYQPFLSGIAEAATFRTRSGTFGPVGDMARGRWYPTTTLLGDGRVMVDSGWDENGVMNETVEIFTPGVGWSPEYPMGWSPPFYIRKHVMPDGRVFMSSPDTESRWFDPAVVNVNNTGWTHAAWTQYGSAPYQYWREYGSSVLLPITPENGWEPTVMILGGNREYPTGTTELIEPMDAVPTWRWGPDMVSPRVRMNATLLPDGTLLTLGGSTVDYDSTTGVLAAEIYDPERNAFEPAGTMAYARLDHSVSILLPDATVWVAGNQGVIPDFEEHVEVYEPAYLFNPDGSLATRPVIDDAPRLVTYATDFTIRSDEAANIDRVVLMRPGAVTHSFDTDQRHVGLEFSVVNGRIRATSPIDSNLAPPGYYMLFLIDTVGVPSVATFIQLL